MKLPYKHNTEVNMKSYTHFTLEERECLAESLKEGKSLRAIARELGRSPSTISREVKRNFSKKKNHYHAWRATILYICRRKNCKRKHIINPDSEIYKYIIECLGKYWSPEIIAHKCKEKGFKISFSTIYRAIYAGILPGIKAKTHLRRKGKKRVNRKINTNSIKPVFTIQERPEEANLKNRLGDWEGDTVYGAVGKGCIVTLVDRKSKLLAVAISPSREKSNIRKAFSNAFCMLGIDVPIETITLDNGSEFADFKGIEDELHTTVYFADPHSPWQRGLNENTNDMLRFFFPKGTNFLEVDDEDLQSVVSLINNRPRKCLDYLSPLEFISSKCCS